jgi:transcriptional regulator with XRE-family HTH domain
MAKALYVNRPITHLLFRARRATGMTQDKLGESLGASKRTVARWETGRASLDVAQVAKLARMVHPQDPALAAELASAASESLESLGLVAAPVAPPPPRPLPPHLVVDAVVCAAADALDAPPNSVRTALHAAFKRARDLRLSLDDVEKALAPALAGKARK